MGFAAAAVSKLRAVLAQRREAVAAVLYAAGGFLMSASPVLAQAPPFGLAFAGAAAGGRMLWASAGAIFGYLTQADPAVSVRWIAALVLLCGLRWAFSFVEAARLALYTPLLAALSCGVTGMAVVVGGKEGSALLVLSESAITAAAGILFSRGLRAIDAGEPLAGTAAIGVGALAGVLLTGAAAVTGGAFAPVYIAVLWLVLCAASFSRAGQALLIASVAGVAVSFAGDGPLLLVFAAGALGAAAFTPLGGLFSAAALALTGTLALLFEGEAARVFPYLGACAIACALRLVTPLSVPRALGMLPRADLAQSEMLRRLLQTRLDAVRGALDAIAATARAVSDRLERLSGDRAQAMIDGVCDEVCGGCARKATCWSRYSDRITACSEVFFGKAERLPARLGCTREDLLCANLRRAGTRYASRRALQRQAGQLKGPTADQFAGTSLLLASLQEELGRIACADEGVCDSVKSALSALGGEPVSVSCFETQRGLPLLLAEVPARCVARLDPQAAAAALSEVVCQPLGPAEVRVHGALATLLWQAVPPVSAALCYRSRAADASGLCGDCCAAFPCGAGAAVLLLCDGMGTGSTAAVDAAMTVSLFTELLRAGVRFDAALRIVSAALLSRGGERLCTVDAAVIDLYALRLESCKAGAAPSYLLRGGRVRRIGANGLPIGILGGVEAVRTQLTLEPGDVVVLVSDGLTDDGDEWIPSQIAAAGGADLEALCESLLQTAADRRAQDRADDCSVLAARIDRAAP